MENQKTKAAGLETLTAFNKTQQPHYIRPEHCRKYQSCNAPICPLDDDWHKRSNQSEDATCFYLIESVKHQAETHFQVAGLEELYERIVQRRADISLRHSRIARKLEAAKMTGSRMARKLGNCHD